MPACGKLGGPEGEQVGGQFPVLTGVPSMSPPHLQCMLWETSLLDPEEGIEFRWVLGGVSLGTSALWHREIKQEDDLSANPGAAGGCSVVAAAHADVSLACRLQGAHHPRAAAGAARCHRGRRAHPRGPPLAADDRRG